MACVNIFSILLLFLAALAVLADKASQRDWENHKNSVLSGDLQGSYCGRRPDGCCPGRVDDCVVPILDTRCYCDMFCNETSLDCCPDFWSFCLGIAPPTLINSCEHDGLVYPPGHKRKDNCNECICLKSQYKPSEYEWRCTKDVCVVRPDLMRAINDGRNGWKASNYSMFWGKKLEEGKRCRLGTMPPENQVVRMNAMDVPMEGGYLPETFDARQKWNGLIHGVSDQGDCAASWAFSTTAVASDRLAIESGGIIKDGLSPQHLVSCNTAGGQAGCDGGYLDRAWWYLRKRGIVSEDCYPYKNGVNNSVKTCELTEHHTHFVCPNGAGTNGKKMFRSTPPYRIAPDEHQIMKEIIVNGPVQATFKVKDDFFMYETGVYRYLHMEEDHMPNNDTHGYHSVRILGWGVERGAHGDGVKYWLCANSWGPQWGDAGYFRIVRGENECQIESFVIGVWGRAPGDVTVRRMINRKKRQHLRYRLDRLRQKRDQLRFTE
ncbi:hypothetical protein ScPMuIL_001462 [Solemya velum]